MNLETAFYCILYKGRCTEDPIKRILLQQNDKDFDHLSCVVYVFFVYVKIRSIRQKDVFFLGWREEASREDGAISVYIFGFLMVMVIVFYFWLG